MSHIAKYGGITIDKKTHAGILYKLTLMGAWGQVLFGFFIGIGMLFVALKVFRRKHA